MVFSSSSSQSSHEENEHDNDRHSRREKKDRKSSSSSHRHEKRGSRSRDKKSDKKLSRRHSRKRSRSSRKDDYSSDSEYASEASFSSSSEEDRRRRRRRKKEKRHKDKKKKHKKSSSSSKEKKSKSKRNDSIKENPVSTNHNKTPSNAFVESSFELLTRFPEMASELTAMLLRMASGTSFDLSQVTHPGLGDCLQKVFASLAQYGVARDNTGSWVWSEAVSGADRNRPGQKHNKRDLVLVKIARVLLNQVGVTVEAVERYETMLRQPIAVRTERVTSRKEEVEVSPERKKILSTLTSILETFGNDEKSGKESSLEAEMGALFDSILEGEIVMLEGIPDAKLKEKLKDLFLTVGLEPAAAEEESSDEEQSKNGTAAMQEEEASNTALGYALPEQELDKTVQLTSVTDHVMAIRNECQRRKHSKKGEVTKRRPIHGPSLPPAGGVETNYHDYPASSSEESDGPAPAGSETAKRRLEKQQHSQLSKEAAKILARKRKFDLDVAAGKIKPHNTASGEREEWMMVPGEHSFLEGIMKKPSTKSRTFKNEKARSKNEQEEVMDPEVKKEMDQLLQNHASSRGPSLIEMHRERKMQEKAEAAEAKKNGEKGKWNWDREKNLDDGRRVDKNALNMIMGGADSNLNTKFQGGFSRGFM